MSEGMTSEELTCQEAWRARRHGPLQELDQVVWIRMNPVRRSNRVSRRVELGSERQEQHPVTRGQRPGGECMAKGPRIGMDPRCILRYLVGQVAVDPRWSLDSTRISSCIPEW